MLTVQLQQWVFTCTMCTWIFMTQ